MVINRKVILTRPILDYDFTFSIIGNGTTSELLLNSDSTIDVFFDISDFGVWRNDHVSFFDIKLDEIVLTNFAKECCSFQSLFKLCFVYCDFWCERIWNDLTIIQKLSVNQACDNFCVFDINNK